MLGLRPLVDAVHAIEGVFKEREPEFSRARLDLLFEAAAALRQAVEQAGTPAQADAFGRLTRLELGTRLEPAATASGGPDTSAAAEKSVPHADPADAEAARRPEPEQEPPPAPPDQTDGATGPDASAEPGRAEPGEADAGATAGEFLRVSFGKLDQLLDQVGELTSVTGAFRALLDRFEEELAQSGAAPELTELVELLVRTTRELRGSVMEARLVPVQRVFSRFPTLARDIAREQGKRVRVHLEGGEVELDRSMVEALGDPLLHLVRNAVDHGIRTPEAREAAGRPAAGTITLRALRLGDRVRVEVTDDGNGLDLEALRSRARSLGLIGPDTILSEQETAELIFRPGFTTRASSDTVSGRGIGLDVVRERVTSLRGALSVQSTSGAGTRFILDLPLTLAILPALVFEANGGTFALPAVAVEQTVRGVAPEHAGAAEVLRLGGDLIPVARADRVFGWHERSDGADGERPGFAVIVRSGTRRGAVLASRLIDQRDLVVKALPAYLGRVPAVSGASIAPDGGVVLLLDPAGLLELNLAMHQRENRAFTTTQDPRRRG